MRVAAGGAASSTKTAIWADSAVSHLPLGAPLYVDNTGVATTGAADVALAFGAGTLAPGTYWFGSKYTGTLPTMIAATFLLPGDWMFLTGIAAATSVANPFISVASAYANAMPTIAEGAAFTGHSSPTPVMYLTT